MSLTASFKEYFVKVDLHLSKILPRFWVSKHSFPLMSCCLCRVNQTREVVSLRGTKFICLQKNIPEHWHKHIVVTNEI